MAMQASTSADIDWHGVVVVGVPGQHITICTVLPLLSSAAGKFAYYMPCACVCRRERDPGLAAELHLLLVFGEWCRGQQMIQQQVDVAFRLLM
jgi:hypothetical protein